MAIKDENTRIQFTIDKTSVHLIDALIAAERKSGRKLSRSRYIKYIVAEYLQNKAMSEFKTLTTE